MAPKSSQSGPSKSQTSKNKTKPASSSLKVKSLNSLAEPSVTSQKRLDPLTAFSNLKTTASQKPLSQSSAPPLSQQRLNTAPVSTQARLKPATTTKGKGKARDPMPHYDDNALWTDMFRPTTEEGLAVHARKIDDVRRWLTEAFDGGPSGKLTKYRRILALTGPAGSGKTSTIQVLSRELNFDILEWRNGVNPFDSSDFFDPEYESPISQFETFIERAANCSSILERASSSSVKRHAVLIEDLPNVLHAGTRERFHAVMQALVNSPPASPPVPIIIIISDSGIRPADVSEGRSSGKWGREEVLDIRTALPRHLLKGPYVTETTFNPIAPTLMKKALQALPSLASNAGPGLMSRMESLLSSKPVIEMLIQTSNGDIRSAIMSLQFACILDPSDDGSEDEHPQSRKKKPFRTEGKTIIISSDSESETLLAKRKKRSVEGRGKKRKTRKNDAKVVLEALTRREHALVLFHLIGKVLWNKRRYDPSPPKATAKDIAKEAEIDARLKDEPRLPKWLHHEQRRTSRVDINALQADSPIDSSLLSLYIQQNYPDYCNEVEECGAIADILSLSDSMVGRETWEYASPVDFHLLVAGTHHGLPTPVKRRGQRVFKPAYFDAISKERDAWDGVRDVKQWLVENNPDSLTAAQWTRSEIVTEMTGILKARDSQLPRSHRLFSSLMFSRGGDDGQILDENDGDVTIQQMDPSMLEEFGAIQAPTQEERGWLENDDIEEF